MSAGILIVEDEVIVAESTHAMLVGHGYRVTGVALTAGEVWAAIDIERPDLVLVDINLGKREDGIAIADVLRQQHDLPVIFVTAYADDATIERAKVSHPFGYVVKPYGVQDLKIAIEIALHNHRMEGQLRQREQALRESRSREQAILENIADPAWMRDLDGAFLAVNRAWCDTLGLSAEQAIGRRSSELLPPELGSRFDDEDRLVLETGNVWHAEEQVGADGKVPRWFETYKSPIRDAGGTPMGIVGIARDITERKLAEEALRESEERFRSVVESSPDAIFIQAGGAFAYVNPAAIKLFGAERSEELVGRTTTDLIHPDDRDRVAARIRSINLDRVRTPIAEQRFLRVDGRTVYVEVSAVPFVYQGAAGGLVFARDITERKRAAEAEQASTARLHAALESMTDAVFISDPEGRFVEFNETFATFHRFASKAECARSLAECPELVDVYLDSGELAPLEQWAVPRALRGETATNAEYTVRRKDTGETWVGSYSFAPIRDPQGNITGSVVVARDVTERRMAQEALRRSNRDLRAVGQCNEALLRATDEATLLREVCRIVHEEAGYQTAWVGYARDDEVKTIEPMAWSGADEGLPQYARLTWADTGWGGRPTGVAIRTGQAARCQDVETDPAFEPWRDVAAQQGYRSVLALPLKNEGGVPFGVLAIYSAEPHAFTDDETHLMEQMAGDLAYGITALRMRAKREAAEQELRKLSRAVEQSPASIIITDSTGVIEYVNPKFTEVTGYTAQEALGQTPRILKSGKTRTEEYRRLWDTISSGRDWRGEFLNRKKSGEIFLEAASISPILDSRGAISHFVALKEDITERRRLEESFRQAQKLEAVGQLAGGIAHDFNNILAAILMNLELLKEEPGLAEPTRAGLTQLEREAHRAVTLTRQLLLFSRRQILDATVVDINEAVNGITKMLGRLLGEDVAVVFQPGSAHTSVLADAGMIDQILMNLCINARDAMPGGGRVSVRTGLVDVSLDHAQRHPGAHPGPHVCLSVADEGGGMDEETQKRIFEPFFTTKEVGKGTGLGLATVYGIVKQHNGWIEVESAVSQGSTFSVYLPAAQPEAAELTEGEPRAASAGSEWVLLVEDDQALLYFVSQALRSRGYMVLEAKDGTEAERIWAENRDQIDLLLSDMVMPGGRSGLELAEILRRDKRALPVVLCSGYKADMSRSSLTSARGISFLQKPFDLTALADTVRAALDASAS